MQSIHWIVCLALPFSPYPTFQLFQKIWQLHLLCSRRSHHLDCKQDIIMPACPYMHTASYARLRGASHIIDFEV